MKLVKKGKPEKKIKGTCQSCKAKFEEKESKLNFTHDRDGRFAEKRCTECGGRVFFY